MMLFFNVVRTAILSLNPRSYRPATTPGGPPDAPGQNPRWGTCLSLVLTTQYCLSATGVLSEPQQA
jgi:hypothetical protein